MTECSDEREGEVTSAEVTRSREGTLIAAEEEGRAGKGQGQSGSIHICVGLCISWGCDPVSEVVVSFTVR
jgi:hypothetical protein